MDYVWENPPTPRPKRVSIYQDIWDALEEHPLIWLKLDEPYNDKLEATKVASRFSSKGYQTRKVEIDGKFYIYARKIIKTSKVHSSTADARRKRVLARNERIRLEKGIQDG